MDLAYHTFAAMCAFGAVVFAAAGGSRVLSWLVLALGFAGPLVLVRFSLSLDPIWISGGTAAIALKQVVRPAPPWVLGAFAGVLSALWSISLQGQGAPWLIAVPLAAGLVMVSALLAWRVENFAPRRLLEEAFLIVSGLALLAFALPGVYAGWQSAQTLNAVRDSSRQAIPDWALAVTTGALITGGLLSLWKRQRTC